MGEPPDDRGPSAAAEWLACCHGFAVAAGGRTVGVVETPVFAGAAVRPAYLVVRIREAVAGRFRTVPVALIDDVRLDERLIVLRGDAELLASFPERIPLAVSGS